MSLLLDKLRDHDWFTIIIFSPCGIALCLIIGIPIYQYIIVKEVELCDCEFLLASGSNKIIMNVWAISKIGILDQEYVISTITGKYRFRSSAVAIYECSKNGTSALIKRYGWSGEWKVVKGR